MPRRDERGDPQEHPHCPRATCRANPTHHAIQRRRMPRRQPAEQGEIDRLQGFHQCIWQAPCLKDSPEAATTGHDTAGLRSPTRGGLCVVTVHLHHRIRDSSGWLGIRRVARWSVPTVDSGWSPRASGDGRSNGRDSDAAPGPIARLISRQFPVGPVASSKRRAD